MDAKTLRHRLFPKLKRVIAGILAVQMVLSLLILPERAYAAAGINKTINYQGKVSLIGGSAVGNGIYNFQFKLFDAPSEGNLLWTETWNASSSRVTMTGGLFSVALGTHTAMTGVNFNSDALYLQVEFDPGNDDVYEEIFAPRRRFGAVPYAHNADALDGLDSTKFLRVDQPNTVTGSLTINLSSGYLGLKVLQTASGAFLHAEKGLSSSGSLVVENGLAAGSGALTVVQKVEFGTGAYVYSSGTVLALDTYSHNGATKHLLFGYRGTFDTNLYRSDIGTLKTDGGMVIGDASTDILILNAQVGSHLIPTADDTYDIGSSTNRWRDLYLGPTSLHIGESGNEGTITFNMTTGDMEFDVTRDSVPEFTVLTSGTMDVMAVSGSVLRAATTLSSSGALVWEGSASGASLWVSTFEGAGLVDCDLSTQKLQWDSTTERFSCGTIAASNWSNTGALMTTFDTRYVNTAGDTMTGALVIDMTTDAATAFQVLDADGGAPVLNVDTTNERVGIGTASPQGLLEIKRSDATELWGRAGDIVLNNSNQTANTWSGLQFEDDNTIAAGIAAVYYDHANDYASLHFATRGAAGWNGSAMVIKDGSVGIGTTTPKAKLDVAGTMSGSMLVLSNMRNCTLQTSATGAVICGTSSSGLSQSAADARYVNTAGDTMTGALTINLSSGYLGLKVLQTASGAFLHAEKGLSSSGSLVVENGLAAGSGALTVVQKVEFGTGAYVYSSGTVLALDTYSHNGATKHLLFGYRGNFDTNLYRSGIGTLKTDGSLYVMGLLSGATIGGAGLVDCDLSTQKLQWDSTTERFSCGTIAASNWSNTGALMTAFDARYVNTAGDTMTGALTINVTNGIKTTVGLNVLNTISGSIIRAQKTLASSGTLVTESGANIDAGTLYVDAVHDRVGIGTTQPTGALHVESSAYTPLVVQSNSADIANFNKTGGFTVLRVSYSGASYLQTDTSVTTALTISDTDFTNALDIGGNNIVGTSSIWDGDGSVGIGTATPRTKLEVVGSMSGMSLFVASSMSGAGLTDCDLSTQKLQWDSTTERFSCGTIAASNWSNTGALMTAFDARYVNTAGDTMTGALVIQNGNTPTATLLPLLNVRGTMSGRSLWVSGTGALPLLYTDLDTGRVGIGTTSPQYLLDVAGYGRFEDSLIINSTSIPSLSFTVDGATKALFQAYDNSIDIVTGAGFDIRFGTNNSYDTMVIGINGNVGIGTATPRTKLEVVGSMSGMSLFVASSMSGAGLTDCDLSTQKLQWDSTTERFSCGTIAASNWSNTGALMTAFDARYVNTAGDTMTGALTINLSSGYLGLKVLQTASGAFLHAEKGLSSSGSLVVENGLAAGSGALTVVQKVEFGTGAYVYSSGTVLALDTYSHNGATKHLLFGYRGTFDTNLYRSDIGTLKTDGSLYVMGLLSGATIGGAGLTNCDPTTGKLIWNNGKFACGTDGGGMTYAAAEGMFINQRGDTMTGALLLNPTSDTTAFFQVNDADGGNPVFNVDTVNEYVGIGTASPDNILHTQGAGTQRWHLDSTSGVVNLLLDANEGSSSYVTFQESSVGKWQISNEGSTDKLQIFQDDFTTASMTFLQTGEVGIGTTTPKALLHVAGTMSGMSLYVGRGAAFGGSGVLISNTGAVVINEQSRNVDFRIESDASDSLFFLDASTSRIGINKRNPKTIFDVVGTISGSYVFGANGLGASGTLVIESTLKTGLGAATIVGAEYQTGAYVYATGASVLALDSYANSTAVARAPHLLFGYRGTFDTNLYRSAANTLQTDSRFKFSALDSENRELLVLDSEESTPGQNLLTITSDVSSNENLVFRIRADGSVYSDAPYSGYGADYAEWFFSKDKLLPGEMVCIDVTQKNAVKRCNRDGDGNLMGIISSNPAFIGNQLSGAEGLPVPGYVLVGLIGQVMAKVTDEGGAIRPGDSLTASSIAGMARKAKSGESTVGVALEGLEKGKGTINVLISRRNQSLTVEAVEEKVLKTIAAMEIEDEVGLMISSALQDLDVEADIEETVRTEIDALRVTDTVALAVQQQIETLRAELLTFLEATKMSETIDGSGSGTVQHPGDATHLAASTLEVGTTLLVGSDLRVGGDLYLDGMLVAENLYVPGSLAVESTISAGRIEAGSGSLFSGTLTLDGTLRLGTGSITFGSGAIKISDLIVERSMFILGEVTINGLATFLKDVEVRGELRLPTKQAGQTRILPGEKSINVRFSTGFSAVPVVTATSNDFVHVPWRVKPITSTGFTIELAEPMQSAVTFSWHAFVTIGDDISTIPDDDSTMTFPLDSKGVPVSSNAVWNACIRSLTMLDASGQPLSCARYHDAATWTHPDLQISFIWNANLTPPFLQLPPGYTAGVTEDAASLTEEFMTGTTEETAGLGATETGSASSSFASSTPSSAASSPMTGTGTDAVASSSSVVPVSSWSSSSSVSSLAPAEPSDETGSSSSMTTETSPSSAPEETIPVTPAPAAEAEEDAQSDPPPTSPAIIE